MGKVIFEILMYSSFGLGLIVMVFLITAVLSWIVFRAIDLVNKAITKLLGIAK
jgi:uncharacterized membrane protein